MDWGGFWQDGKHRTCLGRGKLKAVIYCNEVVDPLISPLVQDRQMIFQQGKALSRTVCQTTARQQHVLQWPARHPD